MTVNRLLILLFAFGFFCCKNESSTKVSRDSFVIDHAQIINVVDGSIKQDQSVLIDSGKIVAIGPAAKFNWMLDNQRVDAENRFVIPGLWDMHVHFEGQDLIEENKALFSLFLGYGITTVRDAASDLGEQVLVWRDEINSGKILGPQIFTAGRKLEGLNSIWKGDLEISNEAEMNQMLDLLEKYQVDFVKITENTLAGDLFLASVKEARKRGFLVSGHVPYDLAIMELARSGFSSIEHASYLLRLGSDDEEIVSNIKSKTLSREDANKLYAANFDQERASASYTELAKLNVSITPTLIGGRQLAYLDEVDHRQDDFLKYLTKRYTANYQWRIDRMANEGPDEKQQRKERYLLIAQQLPYLQKAGVNILAGSDAAALNTYVYPALSLHEELVLFQEAGLTPLEILQSATINGAKFMGKLDKLGTIDVGKEADLVILNKNPLEDIKATQDIYSVVNNGHYFSRGALDSLLNDVIQIKLKLDSVSKE